MENREPQLNQSSEGIFVIKFLYLKKRNGLKSVILPFFHLFYFIEV